MQEQLAQLSAEVQQLRGQLQSESTAREQAEAALGQQERYVLAYLDISSDAFAVLNPDGTERYISPSYERVLGRGAEDRAGESMFDHVHPEDTLRVAGAFSRLLQEPGSTVRVEVRAQHRDGSWRHIEAAGANLLDNPAVAGIVVAFRDITALKNVNEKLRHLFESVNDGIFAIDLNGAYTEANQRLAEMHGLSSREELLGRNAFDFLSQRDFETVTTRLPGVLEAGGSRHVEYNLLKVDGTEFPCEANVSVQTDAFGTPIGMIGVARDVTARKQAEERLRLSEEKLRNVLQSANDGIFALDLRGVYTEVNEKLLEMHGLGSRDEILGRKATEFVAAYDLERALASMRGILPNGTVSGVEYDALRADGSEYPCEASASVLKDASGGPIGIIGVVRDVTERKQRERELKRVMAKLERSNKELEQFAYVASHDLQEPLRMVASYTELLAERYKGRLDEKADRFINYAVDGATRMQRQINDLLTYSRVATRGKPFTEVDCNKALAKALANLQAAIDESGAIVTSDELPTLRGDGSQMVQLFQNLIGNAIKFHTEQAPRVHVSAREQESKWVFSVWDNGIGIERQYVERIFAMFQRLNKRSQYPGTGIGLALCKRIVERHGGNIWVESALGEWSEFYFCLPERAVQDESEGDNAELG
jgi:PAS domain S-box-containing protein